MDASSKAIVTDDLKKVLATHKYSFKKKISVKNSALLKAQVRKPKAAKARKAKTRR